MDILNNLEIQISLQLLLAIILGGLVGVEREIKRRAAGLRTNSLVCLGTTLFTAISLNAFNHLLDGSTMRLDPSRVMAAIITGVGFIGAGLVIYRGFRVEGITTAAGIWAVAGIGIAVGVGFYFLAIFATFLTLVILNILRMFESRFFERKSDSEKE